MKRTPEAAIGRRTADYTEHIDGEVRFIDVRGRFPEAGSETAEEDLRVTGLDGEGKLAVGGSYAVIAKDAVYRIVKGNNFYIEGSPVTVVVAPDAELAA